MELSDFNLLQVVHIISVFNGYRVILGSVREQNSSFIVVDRFNRDFVQISWIKCLILCSKDLKPIFGRIKQTFLRNLNIGGKFVQNYTIQILKRRIREIRH